jgi:excisionase family DNA binding protein
MMDSNYPSLTALPVMLSLIRTCEVLGISQGSLFRHIKKGELPYIKLGRRTLIPREAIENLIKKSFENCKIEYPMQDNQ